MIVTLTPNPSVDHTVELDGRLERGTVLRTRAESSQAGGKGVNISRAATLAAVPTVAVVPTRPEDPFVQELHRAGIDCRTVPSDGPVRVNIAVTEPDGTTTKLNAPGTPPSTDTLAALEKCLLEQAAGAAWVVLAGSLPPGTPDRWYADLVGVLRSAPARVAVDTSGDPLLALVAGLSVAAPHLMKPNGHELASLTGADPDAVESDPLAAASAARALVAGGVEAVLATLGPHGAVLVTAEGAWHADPPPTTVVSTVGAGDSSLFGYLLGHLRGQAPDACLASAVAYGSAAAALPGTTIPRPSQVRTDQVSVRPIDLTQGDAR